MVQINLQGQVTIPPEIQEQLGLHPGIELQLEVIGDALQLRKKEPSRDFSFDNVADLIGAIDSSIKADLPVQKSTFGDLLNEKFVKQGLTGRDAG